MNRTELSLAQRFEFLEHLRPLAHYVCSAFSPAQNTAAFGTDEAEQAREMRAQAIQSELATGYKIVIVEALLGGAELAADADPASPGGMALVSIHRALTELAQTLLRSLQRYTPAPPRLWEQLHQLFSLADTRSVLTERVKDEENRFRPATRIVDAYLRAVMLGAARANTLRPATLGTLFNVLEDWTRLVATLPPGRERDVHAIIDLDSDCPPTASTPDEADYVGNVRIVDASRLLRALERHLEGGAPSRRDAPALPELEPDDLVRHAVQAWGVVSKRAFKRLPIGGRLTLCSGMLAIHYHIGGGMLFEDRLQGRNDARKGRVPAKFRTFELGLCDASPGGYGLSCDGDIPKDLQTGDLLAVQKDGAPDWHIAVVRWFGNGPSGARLGIELLAPRAEPAGARRLASRGSEREWTPVLLLPEMPALRQPSALITPRGAFRVGQKLALNRGGRESKVLLESVRSFTDNFHQYTLTELGGEAARPVAGIEVDYLDDDAFEQFDF